MKRYDDLINKYFDNELTDTEKEEFRNLIQSDEDIRSDFDIASNLENRLYRAEHPFEPNLSLKVMDTILKKSADKAERNIIFGIVSLFVLSLGGLVYYFLGAEKSSNIIPIPTIDTGFLSPVTDLYNGFTGFISSTQLPESTFLLLTGGAIITFYLLYEYHREVKTLIVKK